MFITVRYRELVSFKGDADDSFRRPVGKAWMTQPREK
jgi:hypothetical protein